MNSADGKKVREAFDLGDFTAIGHLLDCYYASKQEKKNKYHNLYLRKLHAFGEALKGGDFRACLDALPGVRDPNPPAKRLLPRARTCRAAGRAPRAFRHALRRRRVRGRHQSARHHRLRPARVPAAARRQARGRAHAPASQDAPSDERAAGAIDCAARVGGRRGHAVAAAAAVGVATAGMHRSRSAACTGRPRRAAPPSTERCAAGRRRALRPAGVRNGEQCDPSASAVQCDGLARRGASCCRR